MGKVGFTPLQKKIFEKVASDPILQKQFYFTGGTALSAFYLNHRESDDLDFFSETEFEADRINAFMAKIAKALKLPYRFTDHDVVKIYEFVRGNELLIKVDFAYYPHKRVELGKEYLGFKIDSLRDIAINKLISINQRIEIKDFVDLYFLLKEFTIWDLIYGVEKKFRMELDVILISSDFMKVEEFDFLPKMLVPLKLAELKDFFKKQAVELAKKVVE